MSKLHTKQPSSCTQADDQSTLDPKPETIDNISVDKLPKHIAIIMDGNNRWARKRNMKRVASGHRAGFKTARSIVECCRDYNIKTLTLFAFSSENWKRPEAEVNALMEIFLLALQQEVNRLHGQNVRIKFIGDVSAFNSKLQERMQKAEALTADNMAFTLLLAVNYGGQWDITQAARVLAKKVQDGLLSPEDITPDMFQEHLSTGTLALPDLMIRTSGEYRISNFMLWQFAYTELYFTDILWPDFNRSTFEQAIISYASRIRRFGQR